MADDQIRYDLLVQDALRGVVRKVLGDAARDGLHGEHHFYVSFNTQAPGVRMSQRLREKYPQDMTIVLQHQFWDLGVTEHTFEVGLSFSGVPERLLVPFEAVTGFFDPSVQFGLKFEPQDGSEAEDDESQGPPVPNNGLRAIRGAASEPSMTPPKVPALAPVSNSGVPKLAAAPNDSRKPAKEVEAAKKAADEPAKGDAPAEAAEAGAEVVSLDAFRKKN